MSRPPNIAILVAKARKTLLHGAKALGIDAGPTYSDKRLALTKFKEYGGQQPGCPFRFSLYLFAE
jgi:hypothetical protein